ncbi:hypothetical protein COK25_09590 [Bacillus cereus]|uniref:hypothetical protein n=1 Tax=Bacillus cereus group TaxID=86661 RepID=UPI000BF3C16E|nr:MULTISPECIES: hypothetical protein [Bacillus cereus group]PEW60151.1 hypothetical protein CN438_09275 [Bacillus cereus]PEX57866.1 hypothetical protein CN456_05895 [Bacillus cereus]PEZ98099.1 hypothetical protein CN376_00775 [Bacillus cereus]PFE97556.1 hypothetical protein CN323_20390 [Bacillus cereus]PFI01434.1 hypothetical protein COI64_16710 [Bacillus cereus]
MDHSEASKRLLLLDCLESIKTVQKLMSDGALILEFSPYISIIVSGVLDFLDENQKVRWQTEGIRKIKKVRAETKIINKSSVSKTVGSVSESISLFDDYLTKDYNSLQNIFISIFGQDNFGCYKFENVYVSNTFRANTLVKKLTQELGNGEEIKNFGEMMSQIICTYLIEHQVSFPTNVPAIELNVKNEDYRFSLENRMPLFGNDIDDDINIILFNILCGINYALVILPQVLSKETNLYKRIVSICCYSSVQALGKLLRTDEQSSRYYGAVEKKEEITAIMDSTNKLYTSSLRNNIFHYGIRENDLKIIREEISFLYGSVEENIGISVSEFIQDQGDILVRIQKLLTDWLRI